ncbi:MAG: crotonase/enoyl-CoA hydratase family protein [Spirochaetes bacterium]|nr:crotonase/enoyl-CoA hydratase family protein [Spirochaetota bacterium]
MGSSYIKVERKDHILLIGINRPEKRNAFDIQMFIDVARAYGELHRDPELWCGLIYAEGPHFTSGLELDKWAEPFGKGTFPDLPEDCIDPVGLDEDKRLGKPMVMAAQGYCYTIGMEMMLATDVRVAASDTRFAQLEVKRGIYPVGGGTVRLLHEVGWSNAMRYLLTGDEISAAEALRMGMVQEVVEPGKQFLRALELAERIAKQAPLAVQTCLKSSRLARVDGDRAALARLLPDIMPLMTSEDVKEGVMSFIERREAKFKGR